MPSNIQVTEMSYYHRALDHLREIDTLLEHYIGPERGILANHTAHRVRQTVQKVREILEEWRYEPFSDESRRNRDRNTDE